jgi:large subunit ribosomal protein L4
MKLKSIDTNKDFTLNDALFKVPMNEQAVYQTVNAELINNRQGTSSSKNRSLVSGGGKKPFRQKGTGNARQGTSRSPLMRGGGVIFGPSPRYYFKKVNSKIKKLAFKCVLSDLVKEEKFKIVESISIDSNKTKDFVNFLKKYELENKKLTIITSIISDNLLFSSRNVKNVRVVKASSCSIIDLMDCQAIIIDTEGLNLLNERFGDKN